MEPLEALAGWLNKAHLGFAKLEHKLAARRGKGKVRDPKAVAAAIGMKKFGKRKMESAAHSGHALGKAEPLDQLATWLAKSIPVTLKRQLIHHAGEYKRHAQAGNEAKAAQHAMHHNAALRRLPMGQRSGMAPLPMSKGEGYPQEEASGNIEAHMLRMKKNPKKYPGGRKQAIAIGISQAREGKKEPKPKSAKKGADCYKALADWLAKSGVHAPLARTSGSSAAGQATRSHASAGPTTGRRETDKARAMGEHKRVLGELKAMKKPNLPKSECNYDADAPAKKKKLRKDDPMGGMATHGVSSSTVDPGAASTVSNFFRKR